MRLKHLFPVFVLIIGMVSGFSASSQTLSFQSDFGPLTLNIGTQDDISGHYPNYKGQVFGKMLGGGKLEMMWIQRKSDRRCRTSVAGSAFWGRVIWNVSGNNLIGKWSYCDDPLGSAGNWNAGLRSGNIKRLTY